MNNVNVQFSLTNFGDEQLSRIDNNLIVQALQSGPSFASELTKLIHFNDNIPEYHNIYSADKDGNEVLVFDYNK